MLFKGNKDLNRFLEQEKGIRRIILMFRKTPETYGKTHLHVISMFFKLKLLVIRALKN